MQPNSPQVKEVDNKDWFDSMFGKDFEMTDDGNLEINERETEHQPEEASNDSATQVAAESSDTSSPLLESRSDDTQARISTLEASVNTLTQALTQLLQNPQVLQQPQNVEPEEEDFDYTDKRSLTKLITDTVQKTLTPLLQPLQQTAFKTETYMAASDAVNRYGQDFVTKLPAIKELMEGDASLTFDTAYQKVNKLLSTLKVSAATNDTTQSVSNPKRPAAELVAKANRLQTQTGINPQGNNSKEKPQKLGLQASFDSAWEELFGQR